MKKAFAFDADRVLIFDDEQRSGVIYWQHEIDALAGEKANLLASITEQEQMLYAVQGALADSDPALAQAAEGIYRQTPQAQAVLQMRARIVEIDEIMALVEAIQ